MSALILETRASHEEAYALFLDYLEAARQAVADGREDQVYHGPMLKPTAEALDAPTLTRQAQYEMIRGDHTQENEILARWMARRASELAPDDADILNPCARVLTLLDRADEAERFVTAALERHPDNEGLQAILANIKAHAENAEAEPVITQGRQLRLIGQVPLPSEDPNCEEP